MSVQDGIMAKDLFIAHIRSFFDGNKEVCFNLAKYLSVKQIATPCQGHTKVALLLQLCGRELVESLVT